MIKRKIEYDDGKRFGSQRVPKIEIIINPEKKKIILKIFAEKNKLPTICSTNPKTLNEIVNVKCAQMELKPN